MKMSDPAPDWLIVIAALVVMIVYTISIVAGLWSS